MKLNKYSIFSVVLALAFNAYSQKTFIKQAGKDYNKFSYVKTSEILLKVAEKGYESVDLFQKLGNSFYFNNKMEDAAKWYGELMAMNEPIDAEYYYRYAQSLKSIELYVESDKWMQKFLESNSEDLRGKSFVSKPSYLKDIEKLSESFEVKNMDLNSDKSDFGINQYKDELIFASSREGKKIYKWNGQPYLDLYSASKSGNGIYSNVKNFSESVNTKMHESTVSFSPDYNVMYFTRNNYIKRIRRDAERTNRLQIYRSKLQGDGSWGNIESLHFNSDAYSVAHPAINKEGTKLYFASDMPGTIGNSDIYVVDINEDSTLENPINLGSLVNTEGNETFPYINSKGDLYFSSNGHTGLGGLDVFMIRDFESLNKNQKPLIIENVGKPINSSKDDFGYYENLETKEGFFTSNREGGKGDDDIYTFNIPECLQDVEGLIYDKDTNELLSGATVRVFDDIGKEIYQQIIGTDAKYTFKALKCSETYLVRAEKEGYNSDEKRLLTGDDRKQVLELDLRIKLDKVPVAQGVNLREALSLNPIYFDFDKSNIRPNAEIELQKVIAVLKQYPKMKIDVKSHTDSRAPYAYNEALSSRRNKATIDYIVSIGGIEAGRLIGRGYGESELINKCKDGVECTEEEHQLNRRSDFIIVSD